MKKILFVSLDNYPHIGGKSTHMFNLIEGLKQNKVQCEVISRDVINKKRLFIKKLFNVPYKYLNPSKYNYIRKKIEFDMMQAYIKKNVDLSNYDAISCQDALSSTIIGRLNKNINQTLTMHTYFGIEYSLDNNIYNNENKYYNKLLNLELESLKYTKKIVCVDTRIKEHIKTILSENYDPKDFYILSIKNFINVNVLNDKKKPHNKFVITCVRRLVEKNGVYYAILAMKYLKKPENFLLKIIGDGPERSKIEKCIIENNLSDCIELVGEISNDEMPDIYKQCDLALVPSITVNGLQEATSISALEAMSCAIPVIASNIGGLSELIDNESNGILVEEKDAKSIAKNIERIYCNKDLYSKLATNARKTVLKNYSHIDAAKKYLKVFLK